MAEPYTNMGYTTQLFYGTPGAAGTNRVTNCKDLNFPIEHSYGDTTIRGDGSTVPIQTEKIVSRRPSVTWTMQEEPNDTALTALRAAAISATPVVALVVKERNAGGAEVVILDGDFNIKFTQKSPLGGSKEYDFEATPSRDYNRTVAFA
jgi:hypothetical protein